MPDLMDVVSWEVFCFLIALVGMVIVQILTGQINLAGLFRKKEGDRSFSPERVQLVLVTLATAFQLLSDVAKDPSKFPLLQQSWVTIFGSSHAIYLGRRLYLGPPIKSLHVPKGD